MGGTRQRERRREKLSFSLFINHPCPHGTQEHIMTEHQPARTRHLVSNETLDQTETSADEWIKWMPGEGMAGPKDVAVYEQSRGGDSAIDGTILYEAMHYIDTLRQNNPTEPWKIVRNTVILNKYKQPQFVSYREQLIRNMSHYLCGMVIHEEPFQVVKSLGIKDKEHRWYYLAETETSKAKYTLFLLRSSFEHLQIFKSGTYYQTITRIENFGRTDFL